MNAAPRAREDAGAVWGLSGRIRTEPLGRPAECCVERAPPRSVRRVAVVCLHGAASRAGTWDRLRAELERYQVESHAFTALGHSGAAMPRRYSLVDFRDDAIAEIERLRLQRVGVVGHSLGGLTALMVAAARPDLVDRLVLEEPPVPPRDANDARPFTRGSELWMRLAAPLARRRLDPRLLNQVLNQLLVPQPSWWESLARIKAPTLIVAGGPTSHLYQDRLRMLADAIPDARLVTVPAGHRVHTKEPDQFIDSVVPFLTRNEPASSRLARWIG